MNDVQMDGWTVVVVGWWVSVSAVWKAATCSTIKGYSCTDVNAAEEIFKLQIKPYDGNKV